MIGAQAVVSRAGPLTQSIHAALKLPTLGFHKFFKRKALDIKVGADVRDICCVLLESLHRHHCGTLNSGASDDERISHIAAVQELFALNVVLEVLHREYISHKATLVACRSWKDVFVVVRPSHKRLEICASYFPQHFPRG